MGKNQAGRIAGHHCTPGQGWRWQEFGPVLMLVTDGGGADVVLSARHKGGGRCELITCGPDGLIQPIKPDSPMGQLLGGVADLVELARDIRDRDDRPSYLPRLRATLDQMGVA